MLKDAQNSQYVLCRRKSENYAHTACVMEYQWRKFLPIVWNVMKKNPVQISLTLSEMYLWGFWRR